MAVNPDWLAQVVETAIDPSQPIVDAHHHLWAFADHPYGLDEFSADLATGHRIIGSVFVECTANYLTEGPESLKPVGETHYVNAIAEAALQRGGARIAAGIVGFADLTLGDEVTGVLAAHLEAAPERFRGIRHAAGHDDDPRVRNSHTNPPPHLYLSERFRDGFGHLARHNLTFDAWAYHHQLPEVTDLARAFPDTVIILDHFCGPLGIGPYVGRQAEIYAQWRQDLAALAACPNVVAKLGGLNMAVNGFGWHQRALPPSSDELVAATRDYYLHAIDCFGPERCMFESNFPVDKLSCSYGVLWNAFKKIADGFSASEKDALFCNTARRVYRLDLPTDAQ